MQTEGRIAFINISPGGVPKTSVPAAAISFGGVEGDRQNDRVHHGGPERAVSLFSLEVIDRLRTEGHPIAPGSTGENLTVAGLDWSLVGPGSRFVFAGGVELEVTRFCTPCATIAASFTDRRIERILQKTHPGESRVYTRVLRPGRVEAGESVRLEQPKA